MYKIFAIAKSSSDANEKDFKPFNEMRIGELARITRSHKKKRTSSLTKLLNHRYLLVVS